MAPPRASDASAAGSDANEATYLRVIEEIAEVQGVINLAEARLVELTRQGLEVGVSGGTALSPSKWLAWQAGIAPERAYGMVRLAERADELPHTIAALGAGELSVDQAAEVARNVPARYDRSAAEVARYCTVKQLRQALPWFRDPRPRDGSDSDERRSIATGIDEHGWYGRFRLPEAEGAIVDQGINAMLEDLKRQARADTPEGEPPERVTAADALVAMAETSLRAGEAARPGTDRYLVHAHLQEGPNGIELMTHFGIVLPEGQRRHILCDAKLRGTLHDNMTPLSVGRLTRVINRRLRRAIEHRDRGCCSVPGCERTSNLQIHHIVHWEDGGPTDTHNLITLCAHHHTSHHNETLGIEGNADLARHSAPGVVFTNVWGHALDPVGTPIRPANPAPGADPADRVPDAAKHIGLGTHHYDGPTGERLDRWGFHLNAEPEPPPTPEPKDDDADDGDGDPPHPDAHRAPPGSPAGPTPTDPTRAGPNAA